MTIMLSHTKLKSEPFGVLLSKKPYHICDTLFGVRISMSIILSVIKTVISTVFDNWCHLWESSTYLVAEWQD